MATKLNPDVRTPTGEERLRLAYLAATPEERTAFYRWLVNYEISQQKLRDAAKAWRDGPPPDVRREQSSWIDWGATDWTSTVSEQAMAAAWNMMFGRRST
jgi:hypothetical protein